MSDFSDTFDLFFQRNEAKHRIDAILRNKMRGLHGVSEARLANRRVLIFWTGIERIPVQQRELVHARAQKIRRIDRRLAAIKSQDSRSSHG